jgi:hypothetical protein
MVACHYLRKKDVDMVRENQKKGLEGGEKKYLEDDVLVAMKIGGSKGVGMLFAFVHNRFSCRPQ